MLAAMSVGHTAGRVVELASGWLRALSVPRAVRGVPSVGNKNEPAAGTLRRVRPKPSMAPQDISGPIGTAAYPPTRCTRSN